MTLRAALLLVLALLPAAAAVPEQVHLGVLDGSGPVPRLAVNWLDGVPEQGATPIPGPSAGFVYERALDGLEPGAQSYALEGRTFDLRVPPETLPPDGIRIVALGDMGISEQARRATQAIQGLDPDLVLHAGDISYSQGNPAEWKEWFLMVEPVAAKVPWLPVLGNHETYTGPGQAATPWVVAGQASPLEVAFFHQRFALPGNELWYSFDWAGVHIVGLDTFSASGGVDEGALPEGEAAWLEQDLRAHADAPWTIVFLHQPPYSSGLHGDAPRVQEAFVPLFEQYGVDLVIGGHDHTYERSYPLRGGAPAQTNRSTYEAGDGVLYVVTGGGGRSLYELSDEQPSWSAARASIYHVVELTITPTELRGRVVPTADDVFEDAWSIRRGPTVSPLATPELEVTLLLGCITGVAMLPRARRT